MMDCAKAFRFKDSVLLQGFVSVVDSLGFVPGEDMLFELINMSVLLVHTSHFDFKENLDSLYLRSVKLGTITPELYAWYQGYHEEYFKQEHLFFFTKGAAYFEELDQEEIAKINKRRLKIGLSLCPAVVWSSKMYD